MYTCVTVCIYTQHIGRGVVYKRETFFFHAGAQYILYRSQRQTAGAMMMVGRHRNSNEYIYTHRSFNNSPKNQKLIAIRGYYSQVKLSVE